MPEKQALPSRIAVTGGAGFIGSHTVELLVERGVEVMVVDDLSHACGWELPPSVDLVAADVAAPAAAEALSRFRPEAVLHLATKGGVVRSLRDPAGHLETSLVKSVALFQAAVQAGARALVAASSGGTIYGDAARLPAAEDSPVSPVSPYGASKAAEELYLASFGRLYGIRTVSLRYGNVYGPRQDGTGEAGLVAITCLRLLSREPPIIYGDGEQSRDFVYVKDVAAANVAALASPASGTVNIGSGSETSVKAVVGILAAAAESNVEPEHQPARPAEVRRVCLNPQHALEWLGWKAGTDVRSGLSLTLDSFRERTGLAMTRPRG